MNRPSKYVPADVRPLSLDDLFARHERHKADIAAVEARLDRVGQRLNQCGEMGK